MTNLAAPRLLRKRLTIAAVVVLLVGTGIIVFTRDVIAAREAANCATCQSNLKKIGLALHNYLTRYGAFPPAYTVDASGRPMHSWRALLLPCFEAGESAYNFSEPWDSPGNLKLLDTENCYRCPSDMHAASGTASYVAVLGNETLWPFASSRTANEIKDGLSNTVALVEVTGLSIPWTKPVDLEIDKASLAIHSGTIVGIGSRHVRGINALLADGSAKVVPRELASNVLRAHLTVAGGEQVLPP